MCPLGVKYILYKHGPFSFDLRAVLSEMESEELIVWEPRAYPYGPSIIPGPGSDLVLAAARSQETYRSQINFIAEKLSDKKVAELERLATALYVSLDPEISSSQRALRINSLKPHVPILEAAEAITEIDRIWAEAEQNRMAVNPNLLAGNLA